MSMKGLREQKSAMERLKSSVIKKVYMLNTIELPEEKKCDLIEQISVAQWLGITGQPAAAPLVLRTADGKYAKLRFSDYDREEGTIKLKYVYAPNGSLKFE